MFEKRDQNQIQQEHFKIYSYPIRSDQANWVWRVIFMGRTVPSFRMLLEGIVEKLSAFRRVLHGEDRAAFDSLIEHGSTLRHARLRLCLTRWMLFFCQSWSSSRRISRRCWLVRMEVRGSWMFPKEFRFDLADPDWRRKYFSYLYNRDV